MVGTHFVVVAAAAITGRGHDLRRGGSEVARAHNARLGHPEAQDQVVPPQGDVAVTRTCGARLFSVRWVAGKIQ